MGRLVPALRGVCLGGGCYRARVREWRSSGYDSANLPVAST